MTADGLVHLFTVYQALEAFHLGSIPDHDDGGSHGQAVIPDHLPALPWTDTDPLDIDIAVLFYLSDYRLLLFAGHAPLL